MSQFMQYSTKNILAAESDKKSPPLLLYYCRLCVLWYVRRVEMRQFMDDKIRQDIKEKANAIIKRIDYKNDGMVSTEEIVKAVSGETSTDIFFYDTSFAGLKVPNASDLGAMMCVQKKDGEERQTAVILLNSDKSMKFRRFSLVHELGHLICNNYTIANVGNKFTLSTHIQYNVFSFPDEVCNTDPAIEIEQQANIFALCVLMPSYAFIEQILDSKSFESLAEFFGVDEEAVRSRALLGI